MPARLSTGYQLLVLVAIGVVLGAVVYLVSARPDPISRVIGRTGHQYRPRA
ncbi:hypothetical protein [Cupriavidus sp. USMAHM13]|uniref:hypothetical protein n=1 Tax=Cupriavidus sp. USMAHM13 TaxID=1389192 RepID=UPI003FA4108A